MLHVACSHPCCVPVACACVCTCVRACVRVFSCLKNNNSLLIDEKWDVVVVGLITVTLLLGIALIGMTWEARVSLHFAHCNC